MRGLVKGKRWLLLPVDRFDKFETAATECYVRAESQTFQGVSLQREPRLIDSLDRLWTYGYERALIRYRSWIDQLRWQRLRPLQKLAHRLIDHLDEILNGCTVKTSAGCRGSRKRQHQAPWPRP